MLAPSLSRNEFFTVILSLVCALFARSWLSIEFIAAGMLPATANDLSYLAVPPILLILLSPILVKRRSFLGSLFPRTDLCKQVIIKSIAVGLLLRLFAWCQLVVGIAFGWIVNADSTAVVVGPVFSFQCRPLALVSLGFFVMAIVVPVVEEITNRALVMSYLQRYGVGICIGVSALLFMLLHPASNWSFVIVAGVVFAIQYQLTLSLWPSVISHVTVNALIQIDWRCLNGQWNPPAAVTPLWVPGLAAFAIGLCCLIAVGALINVKALRRSVSPEGPS